ncbi:hypothetical protein ABH940_002089 [Streptacidiphilus sp. BW17]|uniref:hypothetical protein n=1 Tax=Streptacidiphilus sp. BW17 TaxID=3156274 RepID=UPI0035118D97
MSATVEYDAHWDVFRVREGGRLMADGDGYPLAFDHRAEAEDMLTRRAELFAEIARKRRRR